jgi:hypothetical protein
MVAQSRMSVEIATGLIVKLLGALGGAVLAVVFVPPRTIKGFVRRITAALIAGPMFGPYAQAWAGFSDTWEGMAGAACLVAFASWWLMGAIKRALDVWQVKISAED